MASFPTDFCPLVRQHRAGWFGIDLDLANGQLPLGERETAVTELASDRRMAALLAKLEQDPTLAERLPAMEGDMVRAALDGETVYEIAQTHAVTEGVVWDVLSRVARTASGQGVEPVVTGGLGSDTTPGRTGGYGATGFGDIGNEAPNPNVSEPAFTEEEEEEADEGK